MYIWRAHKMSPLFQEVIVALPVVQFKKKLCQMIDMDLYVSINTTGVCVGVLVWTSQHAKLSIFPKNSNLHIGLVLCTNLDGFQEIRVQGIQLSMAEIIVFC